MYYDNLTKVREKSDLLQWLKYFLIGVEDTAKKAVETLSAILQLKEKLEHDIHNNLGRRSPSGLKLLTHMFQHPVVTVKHVEEICRLSTKAANDLVNAFETNKWLRQVGNTERYRSFIFEPYLSLFE